MAKQPFTSDGVKLKVSELYALSDARLLAEAQLIRSQFTTWITDNFDLTTGQAAYFSTLGESYLFYLSGSISTAVAIRIPITLTTPVISGETSSKRFDTTNNMEFAVWKGILQAPTGSLQIVITYPE